MSYKREQNQIPFYSYSITLTSFLNLYNQPFTKKLVDASFNNSPFIRIGVVGSEKSGKTTLINELSSKFSQRTQSNAPIQFNGNSPDAIYYRSISNLLFIKAPSMNNPIIKLSGYTLSQLFIDRDIMKKFVIGYLAWYSDMLIIVVDSNSDTDYEQYYNEIKAMWNSNDIIIVHNLSKYNDKSKTQLMKRLSNNQLYDANPYINMNIKPTDNTLEYYYKDINNPTIIHVLYEPKTLDELKAINDDTPNVKPNNTKVFNNLLSRIQTCIPKAKGSSVKESFNTYLEEFASQLYENSPKPCIKSTEKENRLIAKLEYKHLTSSFVNINVISQVCYPNYSYHLEEIDNERKLVIDLDIPIYSQLKIKGIEVISTDNVLEFIISIKDVKIGESKYRSNDYSNLPQNGDFQIKIPVETCTIIKKNNVKPEIANRRRRLIFEILQDEEEQVIEFI